MQNKKFCYLHLETAKRYAGLSSAIRAKCGAVLVSPDNTRVLMIGYNGTPSGADNICENVVCENCGIIIDANPYDFDPFCPNCNASKLHLKTKSNVIHAEENVILFCAKEGISTKDCIMYTTHSPCIQCAKMIIASGIKKVIFEQEYRDNEGIKILLENGVQVERMFAYDFYHYSK